LSEAVLAEKKKIMGSSLFSMQYQNEPVDEETATFKISQMRFYEVLPDEPLLYFLTVDPAGAEPRDTSDSSAFVLNAVNAAGLWRIVVAEAVQGLDPGGIIAKMVEISGKWSIERIGIELDNFKMLLWGVEQYRQKTGIVLPITPLQHRGVAKETRIKGLQPRFENGLIEFLEIHRFGIVDDLLRFPRAEHDDLPDALAYQEQIAYAPTIKKGERLPDMRIEAVEARFIESLDKRRGDVDDVMGDNW